MNPHVWLRERQGILLWSVIRFRDERNGAELGCGGWGVGVGGIGIALLTSHRRSVGICGAMFVVLLSFDMKDKDFDVSV